MNGRQPTGFFSTLAFISLATGFSFAVALYANPNHDLIDALKIFFPSLLGYILIYNLSEILKKIDALLGVAPADDEDD